MDVILADLPLTFLQTTNAILLLEIVGLRNICILRDRIRRCFWYEYLVDDW